MSLVSFRCPKCGNNIQLDDTKPVGFCQHCGMKFAQQGTQQAQSQPQQSYRPPQPAQQQEKPKKKKNMGCIVAFVVLSVVIFWAVVISAVLGGDDDTASPDASNRTVAEQQETAVQIYDGKNFKATYKGISTNFFGSDMLYEQTNMFYILVDIESKADIETYYVLRDIYVDDVSGSVIVPMNTSGTPQVLAPHKKLKGGFTGTCNDIKKAKKLEFKVECMDSNLNVIETTETFTFEIN